MATSPIYFGSFTDAEQPTLRTISDYVADARTLLQDLIPPYRYDDPSLLVAFNISLLEMHRVRPDLFVYNLTYKGQIPAFTAIDDTMVPIEPRFRTALLHGLCGHALERDQEDVQDARASTFLALFNAGLLGRVLGGVAGGSSPGGRQQQ